ncbi:helix-turn-helix transcriptional regulator [Pseudonocardia kunmingensis]|uniref:Putative DNA-binding transcriptional regulator YafY n=1 Tax=Pseudonocardia kunmingensis TaxID=630975 RepID=A0A543E2B6_9PSEU|nr:WYL domain-containing protein [Pseudonocardia kunmingensis]TQM15722.1 putative DNA-binding transcriptional regulator YafY [Pseudonocardia kunmingensis]
MRADRLLSLVLLLQHRGRMSATALARELEVSTRTVLRDVDALSAAGVPVYAERGRRGGFALLPGYSTDLTGLTTDEALALLVAGSRAAPPSPGTAPALASAMRKVVAALPQQQRDSATEAADRILVRPDGMISRRSGPPAEDPRYCAVRRAVFAGRKLRIHYAAADGEPQWRTVDPIGLVSAGGQWYLLATRDGADRTYRVSRMQDVEELPEPADRPTGVDLERVWDERRARFAAGFTELTAVVRVREAGRARLVDRARRVHAEHPDGDGWLRLELDFGGLDHAVAMVWALGPDAEVLGPPQLRAALAERAEATARRYGRMPAARSSR